MIKNRRVSYSSDIIPFDRLLDPTIYTKLKEENKLEITPPKEWFYDIVDNCLCESDNCDAVVIYDSGGLKIK